MSRAVWHDLQRLSDAASHLGLAAARYGDRRSAAEAWRLSRRVAEHELAGDLPRMSRADTNLAALAAEAGRVREASDLISGVFRTRLELVDRQPESAAAWRRLTVTARTRADIARIGGQVVEGVRLAADLLADRQSRLGDPAHADVAEARLVLGQALLAAGLPLRARRCLEEAAESRRGRFLPTSHRAQEDLLWLVRTALVLERPMLAIDLLADEAVPTDWFCDRVSFRLGYTARRLLALASGALGRTAEAAAALQADREQLSDRPLCIGLDPLVADFDRAIGEVALLQGDFAGYALTTLAKLAEAEAQALLLPAAHAGLDTGAARARGGPAGRHPTRRPVLPLGHRTGRSRARPMPSGHPHRPLRRGRALRRDRGHRRRVGGPAGARARPHPAGARPPRPGRGPPAADPGPFPGRTPRHHRPLPGVRPGRGVPGHRRLSGDRASRARLTVWLAGGRTRLGPAM